LLITGRFDTLSLVKLVKRRDKGKWDRWAGALCLSSLEEASNYQDKHKAPTPHRSAPCPYIRGGQGMFTVLEII